MCPLMCSFTVSVVLKWASFICAFMDLPLAACTCFCVCMFPRAWGDSYSFTVAHHCPQPFFLSSSRVTASPASAPSQTTARQLAYSPVMMTPPTMAQSLPDGLMGPQQDIYTHTQTVVLKVTGTPTWTPFRPPKQDTQIFKDEFHEMD